MGLLMGALPRPMALGLAWPLGVFAFDIIRIRRRVTLENLAQAFPDKSPAERRRIGRAAFINLTVVAIEMLRVRHLTREKVLSLVHMDEESEALHHRIMKEGKGVVFVSGHYSTWELLAARLAATGYPTLIIVQQQRNPLVNRDLTKSRDRLGFNIVDRGGAVRSVLSTLKEGGVVGILADQDAGRLESTGQRAAIDGRDRLRMRDGPFLYPFRQAVSLLQSLKDLIRPEDVLVVNVWLDENSHR